MCIPNILKSERDQLKCIKKVNFYQLFRIVDGNIETIKTVRIAGIQLGCCFVIIEGQISFGGINLYDYIGRDFQVRNQDGVSILTGIY